MDDWPPRNLKSFIGVSAEYIAGFVDGEAQVSLGRIPRKHSYEYCLRISIYNTDPAVLREIRQTWGGTLTRGESRNPRWKPCYALIWTNAAAARFLTEIAPHLRVKSKQAAALDQFVQHVRKCRRRRDRFGRLLQLSEGQQRIREGFYRHVKNLNRKGPANDQRRQRVSAESRKLPIPSAKYLAGFIDAEGCVRLTRDHFAGWNPQYGARVQVCNTNRSVLEDLRRTFSGVITCQPGRSVRWKDSYQLVWTGRRVEPLLRTVEPYLRIKRRNAQIVMRFIDHRKKTRQGRVGRFFGHLPKHVIAYREALYQKLKKLNAKGPPSLRATK